MNDHLDVRIRRLEAVVINMLGLLQARAGSYDIQDFRQLQDFMIGTPLKEIEGYMRCRLIDAGYSEEGLENDHEN